MENTFLTQSWVDALVFPPPLSKLGHSAQCPPSSKCSLGVFRPWHTQKKERQCTCYPSGQLTLSRVCIFVPRTFSAQIFSYMFRSLSSFPAISLLDWISAKARVGSQVIIVVPLQPRGVLTKNMCEVSPHLYLWLIKDFCFIRPHNKPGPCLFQLSPIHGEEAGSTGSYVIC